MIDGISAGTGICLCKGETGESDEETQDFSNAELVVLGAPSSAEFKAMNMEVMEKRGKGEFENDLKNPIYYPVWAVYGKNLVTSKIYELNVSPLCRKTKVVWASRKPYILSGDQFSH